MNFCSSPFSREQNQIFFLFTIPDRSQALPRYQMSHPWSLMLRHQSLAFRGSLFSRPKCENETHKEAGAPNDNFRKNICSEDDLRSRIFGTFVVKFLACLPLLGFSNILKMV